MLFKSVTNLSGSVLLRVKRSSFSHGEKESSIPWAHPHAFEAVVHQRMLILRGEMSDFL